MKESRMKRIIWYPLMSALLIGVHGQGISPASAGNTQSTAKQIHQEPVQPQFLARLHKTNTVNVSQTTKEINEKTAYSLVWNLPQVQRKARTIQRLSRGAIKVDAIVDGLPTPDDPYYKVRVYEDQPDHNTTIYWFRVSKTGVIEALDVIENQYISLEAWTQQLRRRR